LRSPAVIRRPAQGCLASVTVCGRSHQCDVHGQHQRRDCIDRQSPSPAAFGGVTRDGPRSTVAPAPPPAPTLSSLTLNPTSVVGGAQFSTGHRDVERKQQPAGGAQVRNSPAVNTAAATVPSSRNGFVGGSYQRNLHGQHQRCDRIDCSDHLRSLRWRNKNGPRSPWRLRLLHRPQLSSLTLSPTSVIGRPTNFHGHGNT